MEVNVTEQLSAMTVEIEQKLQTKLFRSGLLDAVSGLPIITVDSYLRVPG